MSIRALARRWSSRPKAADRLTPGAARARRKFLHAFPDGYRDETYLEWERNYKWAAHERFEAALGRAAFARRLKAGEHSAIAAEVVSIESRTNLLFSFEKMALRDAVKTPAGARLFATGLYDYLHGSDDIETRFGDWVDVVAELPRRQTRVLTWPVVTVFGMIGRPDENIFLKPRVTQVAAQKYGVEFAYASRPNWATYKSLLDFADRVRRDTKDLGPRDYIDLQGFIWVQGSEEY